MRTIALLAATVLALIAAAQFGTIDPTFNTIDHGNSFGLGANDDIHAVVMNFDGTGHVAGDFTTYDGVSTPRITALRKDGRRDPTFNVGTGPNAVVYDIVRQPDGKLIVCGDFTTWNGTPRARVARLNTNGSLDATFNPGTGPNNSVRDLLLQPDGKILIGGWFSTVNGLAFPSVARLNANGTLDNTFSTGTGISGGGAFLPPLRTMCLQSDGKVLIGGDFTTVNGTARNNIARLTSTGALDNTYGVGSGTNGAVTSIAVDLNGRVLLGGSFSNYNGTARNNIARTLGTGAIDGAFSGSGTDDAVTAMSLRYDGYIHVAGEFDVFNGSTRRGLFRLDWSGALDNTFVPDARTPLSITTDMASMPDGRVVRVGSPTGLFGGSATQRPERLTATGAHDPTYYGTGANGVVRVVVRQPDGKYLVGGSFDSYNGHIRPHLVRILEDGAIDPTFNANGTGLVGEGVNTIALQPDGKILVGGEFLYYDLQPRQYILRLNTDGTLDGTFNASTSGPVFSIAVQPDGKILLGGEFGQCNGVNRLRLARLESNGTLEAMNTLVVGGAVLQIALRPDGAFWIGGAFNTVQGINRNRIARVLGTGALDATFNPGTAANDSVFAILPFADGSVLIGGAFTFYNGFACGRTAKLFSGGGIDNFFQSGTGASDDVHALAFQPDGKILVGGRFILFNSNVRGRMARLNSNGSVDATFAPPITGTNGAVLALAQTGDDKLIVGGDFTSFLGLGRNRLARVNGNNPYLIVRALVFLEGPFNTLTQLMNPDLRLLTDFPLSEPYTALGYGPVPGGGETLATHLLDSLGNNAIVDWVLVELRATSSPYAVQHWRAALVQRDGDIVDMNGQATLHFDAPPGNYRVAIRHRNHLGCMTLNNVALSNSVPYLDFRNPATATYGTDARKTINTSSVLWAGDVNFDGQIKYTGIANDRDIILSDVGGTIPTNTIVGYRGSDLNMNAIVQYTGVGNDRDPILVNIGGSVPTNVRVAQLP